MFINNFKYKLSWEPLVNPFGLPTASSHNRFAFGDLDNDGDLDIIVLDTYGPNSPFLYFQNTGTSKKRLIYHL